MSVLRQATFTVNGGGGLLPQKAQFISYRLELAGGGTLILEPDLTNQVSLPAPPAPWIHAARSVSPYRTLAPAQLPDWAWR